MIFPQEQIDELKIIAPNLSLAQEGGYNYIFIKDLYLPNGCKPAIVDALLCPTVKEGYESNLYYSHHITGCPLRNWNRMNVKILDRNWFAVSWKVQSGLRLSEMLLVHLKALRS